ncbi:MAG: AraC family transcriptional regulator [Burkholderiaceae bacterium]
MQVLSELPLVGTTRDVRRSDAVDYWRSIFGEVWGPIHMTEVGARQLSGNLRSRCIGGLTFNRIEYGHQAFACANRSSTAHREPFYSLTFPQSGSAKCFVGSTQMTLLPNHAYLINVNSSSRMRVDQHYSTVNIQIPVSRIQNRLGRGVEIIPCDLLRSDPIYHLTRHLMTAITQNAERMDEETTRFLTDKLLDTVAFFLEGARETVHESVALESAHARVEDFIRHNYRLPTLTPTMIAEACGISRSYLYKVFAQRPSVMASLRRCRLEAAREMIRTGQSAESLTAVAMACGFSSSSEFSRLFKKEYGTKPSEFS